MTEIKILAVVVTLLGILIAYGQYHLGKERLKLDLYEKRFSVFSTVRDLVIEIVATCDVQIESLYKFRMNTIEACFLFDDEVVSYLNSIDYKATNYMKISEALRTAEQGSSEFEEKIEESRKIHVWFNTHQSDMKNIFLKYLKFADLK